MHRPEWWPKLRSFGGAVGVLDLAMELHGHSSGSGDALDKDELGLVKDCLTWAVNNWSAVAERPFDAAVRTLLIVALDEAERHAELQKCDD